MEVPNRLSLALADEHDNDTVCQALNEWSTQVEILCNPRPSYHQNAVADSTAATAAASSPAASTAKNSSSGTTATTEKDSPQSTASTSLQEADPSSSSVVVLNTINTMEVEEEEELVVDDDSIVTNLSARLHYKLLEGLTITPPTRHDHDHHHHHHVIDIPNHKATQEFATTQITAWKTYATTHETSQQQNDDEDSSSSSSSSSPAIISPLLTSILRASKNWIRWYLQIYSAKVKRRHIHIVTSHSNDSSNINNNDNTDDDDDDPIHRFKSRIMLDFYMDLLNHFIIDQQQQQRRQRPVRQHEEHQHYHDEGHAAHNNIVARHVALLLFYATFDPIPPDITLNSSTDQQEDEQQHVDFFQNILNLLIHVDGSVPLALALMRNVHNAATAYHSKKGGAALLAMARASVVVKKVSSSFTNKNDDAPACPWAPLVPRLQQQRRQQQQQQQDHNDRHENGDENDQELTFTCLTVFCNMIAFCLRNQVPTPFPGNSSSDDYSSVAAVVVAAAAGGIVADERAELVCEILRTLYASRIGQEQLAATSRSTLDQLDQEEEPQQPHLHGLILNLLQLDQNDDNSSIITFNNDQKHRITECQLDTVSLLMDCGPGLMEYILASQQAVDALLFLLDRQVQCVLEQCSTTLKRTKNVSSSALTGDASAMLTPILVVVHRFCQSSPTFRRQAFLSIFPAPAEVNYQRLVQVQEQQERESQGNDAAAASRGGRGGIPHNNKTKKKHKMNMSPLDAPVDTKRWRMIQLLICVPQSSHVKRFTGELLWLLCNENPQEFTRRVGLGNAMPILAVKGFAQLPTHTFS